MQDLCMQLGGSREELMSKDQLFQRMCLWEDAEFIMAAGTRAGSDTQEHDGVVDGHAYTIMDCVTNVAGSGFDLIRVSS